MMPLFVPPDPGRLCGPIFAPSAKWCLRASWWRIAVIWLPWDAVKAPVAPVAPVAPDRMDPMDRSGSHGSQRIAFASRPSSIKFLLLCQSVVISFCFLWHVGLGKSEVFQIRSLLCFVVEIAWRSWSRIWSKLSYVVAWCCLFMVIPCHSFACGIQTITVPLRRRMTLHDITWVYNMQSKSFFPRCLSPGFDLELEFPEPSRWQVTVHLLRHGVMTSVCHFCFLDRLLPTVFPQLIASAAKTPSLRLTHSQVYKEILSCMSHPNINNIK